MEDRSYFLGFSVFPGVGPKRFSELLRHFGSAKAAWEGDSVGLRNLLGNVYGNKFLSFRETFSIREYKEKLREKDVWFLTLHEKNYPTLLAQIKNSPFVLYGKGEKKILDQATYREPRLRRVQDDNLIGVVGTRRISSYGKQVTEMITEELASAGCVIVSGLAMGVDAVAHRTTIANGGKTIAVLGSGVDVCHPGSNLPIYTSIIASGGAVVSEYPLGEPPSKGSFPSRNRIIAGLSHAVVVTEGASDSGALYTAHDAFAINRPVFAVPGPITSSLSRGPNSLLAKGAKIATKGKDILDELGVKNLPQDARREEKMIKGDTEEEQRVITLLLNETLRFDEIVRVTKYDAGKTGVLLSLMEMKGIIQSNEGQYSLKT